MVRSALTSKPLPLALGIDVTDVVGNRLLLFFQPLDALDDGLELVFCEFGRGLFRDGGSGGGHRVLLTWNWR